MPKRQVAQEPVQVAQDASSALYKDRSGQTLGGGHKEGANYMETIAQAARESVREAERLAAKESK